MSESEYASEWRVIARDGRELLRGAEADARHFVETHFPHVHAPAFATDTPPEPDVKIVAPDGGESTLHPDGWHDPETTTATTDTESVAPVTENHELDFGGSTV